MQVDYPVETAAEKLGWQRERGDKTKFRKGNLSVFISKQMFNAFKPGSEHMNGAGPVSFIMKSENVDFKRALKILEGMTGACYDQRYTPMPKPTNPATIKKVEQRKLFRPPYRPQFREDAEKYLVEERKLSPGTVAELFRSGLAYPSEERVFLEEKTFETRKAITFVYADKNDQDAAFQNIHLTGERGFKKFSYGSRKKDAAFIVKGDPSSAVLFEAVIDLLSFVDLGLRKNNETLIAFGGNPLHREENGDLSPKHPVLEGFSNLKLAFDNDQEGAKFDFHFLETYGSCLILKPYGKDFNEDLKLFRAKTPNIQEDQDGQKI